METLREHWENPTHKVEMEMPNQVKGEVLELSDFKCIGVPVWVDDLIDFR